MWKTKTEFTMSTGLTWVLPLLLVVVCNARVDFEQEFMEFKETFHKVYASTAVEESAYTSFVASL